MTLEVTDVLGQVVYRGRIMAKGGMLDELVDVGNAANGMYVLSTGNKQLRFILCQATF